MKFFSLLLCSFFLGAAVLSAQTVPAVFPLGENEAGYETLNANYTSSLLTACDNDIEKAFGYWMEMMQAMEQYATDINYDLKGARLWFHVFWGTDGKIRHIGYLMRPDSRLLDAAELEAFLKSFIKRYQFPVTGKPGFSHYTGATFPTLGQRVGQ